MSPGSGTTADDKKILHYLKGPKVWEVWWRFRV